MVVIRVLRAPAVAIAVVALVLGMTLPPPAAAQPGAPRLVVFESFSLRTCPSCTASGPVIDRLAAEYGAAGRPVLFMEHDANAPTGNRIDRWYDASSRACGVPWAIVDSGFRHVCGDEEFEPAYRQAVEDALARPPAADLRATWHRTAGGIAVTAEVTNWSGEALRYANNATVNVIVFEPTHEIHTGRFVRAGGQRAILEDLADGGTATYALALTGVPVERRDRAVVLVLVDYQPDRGSWRYESLQATVAAFEAPFQALLPVAFTGRGW